MGVVTTLSIYNHTCAFRVAVHNRLTGFFNSVHNTFRLAGYARAADELQRIGYHEAARRVLESKLELQKHIDTSK